MRYSLLALGLALTVASRGADWKSEVVFRATFDGSLDARTASGDPKLYHAPTYKDVTSAQPGVDGTDVSHAKDRDAVGGRPSV